MNLSFDPPCGPITGWRDGAVVRAAGIPYATAERFQPPAPAPDWSETLDGDIPVSGVPAGAGALPG